MKKFGTKALPANRVLGFTLTELMISLSLGLGLMTLMIDTIANISRAGRVSAEAAEATERAYFMIDVLDAWVSETAPLIDLPWLSMSGSESVNAGLVSKKAKTAAVAWALGASGAGAAFGKKKAPLAMVQDRQMVQATEKDGSPRAVYPSLLSDHSIAALDLCESPTMSSFPLNRSGIAVVSPDNLACIPARYRKTSAPALFLERRLRCPKNCSGGGFYALTPNCFWGDEKQHYGISWVEDLSAYSDCFSTGDAVRISRSLVYIRDYSWRVGDGMPAVMLRDLARESDARWLRSTILAHDINDWRIICVSECKAFGGGALLASAIDVHFTATHRDQSIGIHRVLTSAGRDGPQMDP